MAAARPTLIGPTGVLRRALGRIRGESRAPAARGLGWDLDALPHDLADPALLDRQARAARTLEKVYHRGQERIWDGRDVLGELVREVGPVSLPDAERRALQRILYLILWGELAAWRVSADLAAHLDSHESRLAATSQAHDEARHFYVMYDYLSLLGERVGPPPAASGRLLQRVLDADTLAKKLVGMQLLVEPIALTLFALMRQSAVCPVLSELLPYYERDEARHVAVGAHTLPTLVDRMSLIQAAEYWTWQARLFRLEVSGLAELEDDFRTLGFEPREVFRLGQGKQLAAARLLADELDVQTLWPIEALRAVMEFTVVYSFPEAHEPRDPISRLRAGVRAALKSEAPEGDLAVA